MKLCEQLIHSFIVLASQYQVILTVSGLEFPQNWGHLDKLRASSDEAGDQRLPRLAYDI